MNSIYNQTTYVELPNIQAARALKRKILTGGFSNWCLGKAQAFRLVSTHYKRDSHDHSIWRGLMRDNALRAIRDAKLQMEVSR